MGKLKVDTFGKAGEEEVRGLATDHKKVAGFPWTCCCGP